MRRDRGAGGEAKAKSIISLNESAQTCRPSKTCSVLHRTIASKRLDETLETDFLLPRAVTFPHERPEAVQTSTACSNR
jgi:hypothetical protein